MKRPSYPSVCCAGKVMTIVQHANQDAFIMFACDGCQRRVEFPRLDLDSMMQMGQTLTARDVTRMAIKGPGELDDPALTWLPKVSPRAQGLALFAWVICTRLLGIPTDRASEMAQAELGMTPVPDEATLTRQRNARRVRGEQGGFEADDSYFKRIAAAKEE